MDRSARIKLLWLIDSLTMGGAERLVATFARWVDRERFQLEVACLKVIGGNPIAAELEQIDVPVTVLHAKNLRDLRAFRRLVRLLRAREFELVHTHLTYADIWGRLAGWRIGCPVVSTLHVPQHFNYWSPGYRDPVIERLARFARTHFGDAVVAVSDWLRRYHVSRGLPAERVVMIHNGIDLRSFALPEGFSRAGKRQELGIPTDAPVVIQLSVVREGKGHETLLAAAPIVLDSHPDTRFLIVGGGPLEQTLRDRVRSAGLTDRVVFTGQRSDNAEMMAVGDINVLPSENDPQPGTVVEAMAMSLPVVGLDSGGVPEMVLDGETGLLVKGPDPEALAAALGHLLDDPERARRMGERGRQRVESHFSAEVWARKLERLYEQTLGARSSA